MFFEIAELAGSILSDALLTPRRISPEQRGQVHLGGGIGYTQDDDDQVAQDETSQAADQTAVNTVAAYLLLR